MKSSGSLIDLPLKKTLRPDEVASVLSLSRRTVYRWVRSGRLPSLRLGGSIRVLREDLITAISLSRV
jgi:excisionase family DNA binding protein